MQYSDFVISEKINLQEPSRYDNIPFKEKGVAAMNENKIVFQKVVHICVSTVSELS